MKTDSDHLKAAASLIVQARLGHQRLARLPEAVMPGTIAEAYACQKMVVDAWLAHYGGELAGYKVACTNPIAQRQLGVDGPFSGQLLGPFLKDSPAAFPAAEFFMCVLEAEFAFRMGADLPPSPSARTRDEIAEAIDCLVPAIEIVDSRFDGWTTVGAISAIADNACNGAWVRGPLCRDWRDLDLASHEVKVSVNGTLARAGNGAAVMGHPLNALQWLVNHLSSRGIGVKEGHYLTTGVVSEVYEAKPGDHLVADFGRAGRAEVTIQQD